MSGSSLITGANGRLGRELTPLLPDALAPARAALDVTDAGAVLADLRAHRPATVLHAAAYTDVAGAEREPETCWRVNVLGTRNVADACAETGATLVHVSTDYVFWGDADPARAARGGYREDDATGPVRNRYALSKLAAEDEARHAGRLIDADVHVLHLVGPPTTVFELARRRKPDVRPATKAEAGVALPDDVVLNRELWLGWRAELVRAD